MGETLRTMFLWEYISDRSLRQEITACTNKVGAIRLSRNPKGGMASSDGVNPSGLEFAL